MRIVRCLVPLLLLAAPLFLARPAGQDGAAPLVNTFKFRAIGPASMGGRIDDIAVSERDPNVIYVGYAVGGVFKSDNNGTTFTPVYELAALAWAALTGALPWPAGAALV